MLGQRPVQESWGLGPGCSLLPHLSQALEEVKTLGTGQGAGPVQSSPEKEQSSGSGEGQTPLSRTWGHRASQGAAAPGAKCRAGEAGLQACHRTLAGKGSGSVPRRKGGMISCPRSVFRLPPAPNPSVLYGPVFKPPAKPSTVNGKPGDASDAAQIPALLPELSPYRAPGLASIRCCLSVGSMRPRAPCAGSGKPRAASEPGPSGKLSAGRSAARTRLPGGPRAPPAAPLRPRLSPAACLAPQLQPWQRWGRPAAAPAAPTRPRPAPARFIRPRPPRVKRPAARRVQKAAGKGEGWPAAESAPALPQSTPSPAPLGPEKPTGPDSGLGDGCAHSSPRAAGRIPPHVLGPGCVKNPLRGPLRARTGLRRLGVSFPGAGDSRGPPRSSA